MHALDGLIPEPQRLELDHVDVAASPEKAWQTVRHGDLASSPIVRALFAVRTIPARWRGREVQRTAMRIDDIVSAEGPGFRLLAESDREVALGAIGKVWQPDIPFIEVRTAEEFLRFQEPGYAKVAWALRVIPRGETGSRIEVEVRVAATDDESWTKFRRYFRLIGPGSRFIRHHLLSSFGKELGAADAAENERPLPGDGLLPDAAAQLTHAVTIRARPEDIWPWLVQMGCRRAGWYSYDFLDNAGIESAREIHPELQRIEVGDVLPATPEGEGGFEVLRVEPPRTLVLGGLFDPVANSQLPFASPRPERFWHVSWAFALEPIDGSGAGETRLLVRGRAAFSASERLHAAWARPIHHLMEKAQLRGLARRVEGRMPRAGVRDVASGLLGASEMALSLLTPFLRDRRSHWGLDEKTAGRGYPGDDLVPSPRWSWTHGVEIDVPAEEVWPWVVQIGADRAGFYSYQWLENLAGAALRNSETLHPEWAHREGDELALHPKVPGIPVTAVEPGRYLLAHAPRGISEPYVTVSWLLFVEPLSPVRSRLISRFRSDCSEDFATRLAYGPILTEPVGYVMDRRMLQGVKERAERRRHQAL
jgi:hypothetical protein